MFAHLFRRSMPALVLAALAGCTGQSMTAGLVPQAAPAALSTTMAIPPSGDATPLAHGPRIFTANRDGNAYGGYGYGAGDVLAFDLHAGGNVKPVVNIGGSKTTLYYPYGLAEDAAGNIYVANDSGTKVAVFAPNASGNVKPTRMIGGSNSNLGPTEGITVDSSGNLWVGDYQNSKVTEYPPNASGNVAPINTIGGSKTLIDQPLGVAVNTKGQLFVANRVGSSIEVFAAGASGNTAPLGTIGGYKTGLLCPFAMTFDHGGRLLVADDYAGLFVYAKGAIGDVKPVQHITGFTYADGVAVDEHDHIYVADGTAGSIKEFASNADGNATPIRTIAGSNTGFDGATYLVIQQ